jgi:hypothetical protein
MYRIFVRLLVSTTARPIDTPRTETTVGRSGRQEGEKPLFPDTAASVSVSMVARMKPLVAAGIETR